jgi:hypothetical protein
MLLSEQVIRRRSGKDCEVKMKNRKDEIVD